MYRILLGHGALRARTIDVGAGDLSLIASIAGSAGRSVGTHSASSLRGVNDDAAAVKRNRQGLLR
jgi:hypothetical protein